MVIARALAQEAPIVLMDEPTGSLDIRNQLETMSLLYRVVEDNGLIAILSLHDINLAAMFSHRVAMLKEGRLVESGPVEQVINEGEPEVRLRCRHCREQPLFRDPCQVAETDGAERGTERIAVIR